MKPRRLAAAVLFSLLAQSVALPSFGQDDPVTVQARARFKEGVEAFDKGKYEEARLSFLQAYTLKKHPSVLLNLAQSSAKSGHHLEASKYFQQYLKEATTATAAQKKDAESGLAEVRQRLGRIDVVAPAGTEISIDDQKVGATPMEPVDVEIGQHTVKSAKDSVTVTAVGGQKVEAKLGAQATPPPPVAPVPAPTPAPGPAPEQPAADTGKKTKSSSLLSPPEAMTPVYIGLGVTGVGIVSAIVFAAFKSDAQSKANSVANEIRKAAADRGLASQGACLSGNTDLASACKVLKDNNDKVDSNATIANVSIGVAVAGALFAGIWYLAAPKREDDRASAKSFVLSPYAGWGTGGLSLQGAF